MDFFDPKKKRALTFRLYLGYVLMGIALLIGTVIIWYQTYGYDIDRQTGAVIQKGLVFVDAHPESATIFLNNKNKGQTGSRLTPVAGRYTLELKRSGYRSWKHDFELYGGTIERFVYPFLFPDKLITSEKQTYISSPPLVTASPDRHWLIVEKPGSLIDFDVLDMTNPSAKIVPITLPADVLTPSKDEQHMELVEWSTDNRHVLLKHVFGSESEYVLLDRDTPLRSLNISKVFRLKATTVSLRNKKSDQFYFYTADGGILQTADLKSNSMSPLLTRVLAYRSHGSNTLLYVTDASATLGKVKVRIRDNNKDYTLKELPADNTYLLALAQFNEKWYIAAGASSEGKISIYQNPADVLQKIPSIAVKPISTLRVDKPTNISFSINARFIMAQNGSSFAVYDAERDRQYRYNTGFVLAAGQKASWMDGHRIVYASNGSVVVVDFDGTNQQTLSPAKDGYDVFFDSDYKAFYTVSSSKVTAGADAVLRTELVGSH